MVSRHMALVGDALSHVALPGLALGILFNFNPFAGAFAILALTAIATWYLQKSSSLSLEAIIGVLFVLALAIGILITPQVDLLEALFGDISKVTLTDAILVVPVSVIVVLATRRIYKQLVLTMISRELAISRGVRVERIDLVFLLLVSAVVAIGIKEVGTLLVGAVVIVPAAAARNVSSNIHRYVLTSSLFGLVSALLGIILSSYVNLPAGPLVVIVGAVIFGLGLIVPWANRRRHVRREEATMPT
jgi:ABC-type Mn2+/Zn2+ transport system permease subunit